MTEPLTPPGCDMSGNDWFPLYFDRLRKSKWWRRASDMARARNVMLWGEAYRSVPAGSLADDDDDLAESAGFGFDVPAFIAVKAEIMAPWVLCSDGRWYHPTVCESALDSWNRLSEKRRAEREKKAHQRASVRAEKPNVPAQSANVPRDKADVPEDNREKAGGHSTHTNKTGQTGQTDREADASLSTQVDLIQIEEAKEPKYPEPFEACWKAYPHSKGRSSKPKALGFWRRLPRPVRDQLPAAAARYAREGREPKADCGAAGMHLWLRDEKFADWLTPTGSASCAEWPDSRWRAALALFAESGLWSDAVGPKPSEPGCRAPAHVLADFSPTKTLERTAA